MFSTRQDTIAWFPGTVAHVVSCPNSRIWAGSTENHVLILALEGSPPLHKDPVRELSLTVPTARQPQRPPTPSATVKEGQSDGVAPGSASAAIADEVAQELLEDLFGALPQATRGVVCWRDPATNRLVPRAFKCRGVDDRQPVRLVRTLVTQAIDRRQAFVVVSGEGGSLDEAFRGTLRSYRHVMCAPLIANEGPPLGIVQIEALDPSRPFDKQDLETLTSVTVRCLSRL